jgi:hypothetical protein
MSENVLILRSVKFEFPNEKTGEIIKGCNVIYVSDYQEETASAIGEEPMKAKTSEEVFALIKKHKAPAIYSIDTRLKPGKDGKATVQVTSAKFVKAFSLAA